MTFDPIVPIVPIVDADDEDACILASLFRQAMPFRLTYVQAPHLSTWSLRGDGE